MNGNGNTEPTAGLEPVDGGHAVDHGKRHRDLVTVGLFCLADAAEATGEGDLIEAATLCRAWLARNPAPAEAPGQGQQGSEGAHGEAAEDGPALNAV